MGENKQNVKSKFDYKWVIIVLCFLMVCICLGFCSSNRSLYLSPITEALGIKRSAYAVADSIRFITTAVVNVFFGTLVKRFGTKKLITTGFLCLITSVIICSFADQLIWFYLSGMLLGIGFSWTTTTMVGCVVNKWCKEKKGTIMGAVLAANGIGAAVAAQILSPLIYQEGNPFGYRNAYLVTAMILGVVLLLILIFYKDKPQGMPQEQQEASKENKRTNRMQRDWEGIHISIAVKNPFFYCAAACIFVTGMVLQGITGIAAAHMKDVGIDPGFIATVVSVHSLALAASKFITGILYDKFGLRITVFICDAASVAAMIILACLDASPIGVILAVVYAVVSAMALPLETIMLPLFASDLFGAKSYEQILGLFVSVNTAGYAVGVPLMNVVFDITGSYRPALLGLCAVMLLILVVFQLIINASKKWKNLYKEEDEK